MHTNSLYPFTAVVGQEQAKKALLIALVNPRVGGLLIGGRKGTAKSILARSTKELIGSKQFIDLPLNVTEDMLLKTALIQTFAVLYSLEQNILMNFQNLSQMAVCKGL